MQLPLILIAAVQLASAHFGIEYPEWRADTLTDEDGPYSQYEFPCANVPGGAGNRTDWPLSGGAVSLHLHHAWTYVYINLGLGTGNLTNFNISLTPQFYNVTGNGTFCLPTLSLPAGIADGTNASIQVVTSGQSGTALYNCADITLRAGAPGPASDVCVNTTQSAAVIGQSTSASNSTNTTSGTGSTTSGGTSGASGLGSNIMALSGFAGLAILFATGMSL